MTPRLQAVCRPVAFAAAIWLAAGLGAAITTTAAGHTIDGTETLIHLAAPGVEIAIAGSIDGLAALAAATGAARGEDRLVARLQAAWTVRADGRPCPPAGPGIAVPPQDGPDGHHHVVRLRFDCPAFVDTVDLSSRLPVGPDGRWLHVRRVMLADRISGWPDGARLLVPVGELLRGWGGTIAPDYFWPVSGGRDAGDGRVGRAAPRSP